MAQKKHMAQKQGALSHMMQAYKTVGPYCFPSCPSRTYPFCLLAFLEICIHRIA